MLTRMHKFLITTCLTASILIVAQADGKDKVRVYLLAGQSNMEGKAKISLLEHQARLPDADPRLASLKTSDGNWHERDDVFIQFLDRKGKLTVGFGSPNCIGPELQFGNVMGDHFDDPVVIIKTAWGGKSLWSDFRPPSSGLPQESTLVTMLENQKKKIPERTMDEVREQFGHFYREMIAQTRSAMADIGALFPELKGRTAELEGIVWFQGWNDMINPDYTAEYTANMANFIRDARKDLAAPEVPFVIGVMGVDGKTPNEKQQAFRDAQAAPASLDEFKGNVAVVQTSDYWDEEAHAVFKKGWKEHLDEWNSVGSDFPFHYLGSAKTMLGIGQGFADALLELSAKQ